MGAFQQIFKRYAPEYINRFGPNMPAITAR